MDVHPAKKEGAFIETVAALERNLHSNEKNKLCDIPNPAQSKIEGAPFKLPRWVLNEFLVNRRKGH